MAKTTQKKKKNVTKASIIKIREHSKKDHSPTWENHEEMSQTEFLSYYHSAMSYYNLQFSSKDLKPAVISWMQANEYSKEVISEFKKIKDWRISTTMGSIASCLLKGMPEERSDFNNGKNTKDWLVSAINKVIEDSKNDVEIEDDAEIKPTTPIISIQERVKESTFKMTEEIEDAIENWIVNSDNFDPKQYKIINLLKGKEAKPAHARIIRDYYANGMNELTEVLSGSDDDLKEGYKHKSKKQINSLLTFYKEIESACNMLMEEAKVTRKPRAKKAVPKDKLVEKLKYMKSFEPLKLVSINPTDILGAKELWTYNTKTRKLGKYLADDFTGPLSIKGTTIVGFDEHKSVQKTIRKPDEKLKEFKNAGKIALRKFLDDINATDTKMNGRINEEIILLKVSS